MIKEELKQHLENGDFEAIRRLASKRKVILSKLLAFTFHPDEAIRWKAVEGIEIATEVWIKKDPKCVKDFCRRLFWMLNDESGNMGWFVPQVIGAVLAKNHEPLHDFLSMLIAVLDGEERPEIVQGTLWALGHIGPVEPEFANEARFRIQHYLHSPEHEVREEAQKSYEKFGGTKEHAGSRAV